MKDIHVVFLLALAMVGPLCAMLYERKTEKNTMKNEGMTAEEGIMNSAVIAIISVFPFSIIILSRVAYLFFN